ncbi:MAG: hypothetical protein DRN06_06810 [Thermoprotei archaeon]|nr:MAG: hypothetical protein DRN06_06810 [Thermoprotei archaeon]
MPTATKLVEKTLAPIGYAVFVPYMAGGALKALYFCVKTDVTETDLIFVADFTNKDIKQLSATQPYSDWVGNYFKPWKIIETKNKIIIYGVTERSGYLVVLKVVFDKYDETVTISEYKSIALSWLDNGAEIKYSNVIGDILYIGDYNNPILHAVNLVTGTDVSVDLSEYLTYVPFTSWKVLNVILDSTSRQIMILGEHYSGSSFYVFDINRLEIITTLPSTGGGSPRPCIGGLAVFGDERVIPLSSGAVECSDNDMDFYDEHLNKLGTFDLAQIIECPELLYGFNLVAKLTDGKYFGIGSFYAKLSGTENQYCRFCWVLLNSDFSYYSHEVILETSAGEYGLDGLNLSRSGGNITNLPIIDLNNYKAYIWLRKHDVNGIDTHYLYEVDFSDLSVDEINSVAYLIG